MPAGDLLTGNYQVEIEGVLTGDTTVYRILADPGIQGLGQATIKTQDFTLQGQEGVVAGQDYLNERIITVPYAIVQTSEANALDALETLRAAWEPVTADVELHFQVPDWGHCSVTGRPRGLSNESLRLSVKGVVFATGTFLCTDPTITTGL